MEEYFPRVDHQQDVRKPLGITHQQGRFDVFAKASGGGITGQSGAVRLGIARALIKLDPGLREALKPAGMLRCDSRRVERKKFGKRGARRSPQFSKR